MAAGDLALVSDAMDYIGRVGDSPSELAFLERLVTGASTYFRSRTGRDIQAPPKSYPAEKHSGDGNFGLFLKETPVTAVTSVAVDGESIPAVSVPGESGWVLADADTGRLELIGFLFTPGAANVSIAYTAGYATVPEDIAQAVIEIAAWKYRERDRLGETARTTDGQVSQFTTAAESIGVKQVIDNYRRRDL